MAGIGFELKKLFNKKGYFYSSRAYIYSTIVSAAPLILCTLMVTFIQLLLTFIKVPFMEGQLFLASVVYAFIFSQIITSGFTMVITRYISDRLFSKEYDYILSSLYGVLTLTLAVGALIGGVFYYISPIEINIKIASYVLYMELIMLWVEFVYLSALKDYTKVAKAFFIGVAVTMMLAFLFIKINTLNIVLYMLLAMDIGIFITVIMLLYYIEKFFNVENNKYFDFIRYFKRYPSLFLINLSYTLGIYIHNIIFWNSKLGVSIYNTYRYAPLYDVAVFYAFLSGIPSIVTFVVSVETSFYDKYKMYYGFITNGGNFRDIQRAKNDMTNTLWREILHIMQIQLVFTILFLLLGKIILPRFGVIGISLDMFNILVIGVYCNMMMLVFVLLQLYFDDRKGALMVTSIFILSNIILTICTLFLGTNYYGFGFFGAAFISATIGFLRLSLFMRDIDYHTFCSQPVISK
ncbi:exopolysaccharide Pel transporter PelG [Clostridium algidicarnis]|uniref:Putative membrane protein n=1 Tax=Clostridium algidicarnis DSM 15099 TaxID=1121295 RepID=A0A2S6FZ49_9CLOT|nr:exopolysaccharide Pel transporter PelG [Clostridium algidicarnis]PPK48900.1 putative membrane protein [Clostridium algidicarnis DSM 15099]